MRKKEKRIVSGSSSKFADKYAIDLSKVGSAPRIKWTIFDTPSDFSIFEGDSQMIDDIKKKGGMAINAKDLNETVEQRLRKLYKSRVFHDRRSFLSKVGRNVSHRIDNQCFRELTGINASELNNNGRKNKKQRTHEQEQIWGFLPYYVPTETISPRKRSSSTPEPCILENNALSSVYKAVVENAKGIKVEQISEHYKQNMMSVNMFILIRSDKKRDTKRRHRRKASAEIEKNVHFIVVKKSDHAKRELLKSETLYNFLSHQTGADGKMIMNAFASLPLGIMYGDQSENTDYPPLLKKDALLYRPAIYGDCVHLFSNMTDAVVNVELRRMLCKQIIYQLLIISEHIHRFDIVHRDIKLDNVIVMDTNLPEIVSGKVKAEELYIWINLADWEFSTKIEDIEYINTSYLKENKIKIPGSYEYAAPEIILREYHASVFSSMDISDMDKMAINTASFFDQKYNPKMCDIFSIGMMMVMIMGLSSPRSDFSTVTNLTEAENDFFRLCCHPIANRRCSASDLMSHVFLKDVHVGKKAMEDYIKKFVDFGNKNVYYRNYTRKLNDLVKERKKIDDIAVKSFCASRKKKRTKRKKTEIIVNK